MFLFTLGVLRASTVYFRCREEQSDGGGDRCNPPSEFHMPIGNLPSTADYASYKNNRFFATIASTFAVVAVPIIWLRSCGNLNGFGLAVVAATYLPPAVGLSMVAYWAMQGHRLSQQLVPWQQNILAKAALGLSAALSAVTLLQPRLLFVTSDKEDPSSSAGGKSRTSGLGVKGYYQVTPHSRKYEGPHF